jgi:adenylate cyclase
MNDTTLVRRLTTILAIDVVAFSTMSARDEEHALALLGARMDAAGTLIRQHRGRVFKLTGDGLLAEFASPVEAVRAALEIQEAMRSANATASADDQLHLRIGVNLGDVVESGDDLMGDAVNVAVRLESIATTGGICVSSSVYDQIIGKLMLGAEDIGEQHVKNIPRPIHAYRLTVDGKPPPPSAAAKAAAKPAPRARLFLVGGAITALAIAMVSGTWFLREGPVPAVMAPQTVAAPAPAPALAATPEPRPPAATPAPPRLYSPTEVPFVPDFRRRTLENYGRAEGSKALALNVRGFFGYATRRIDDATARRVALDDCNRIVQKEVPVVRDFDRCQLYAVGNDVVWSFRSPAMPLPPFVPPTRPNPAIPFDPATAPLLNDNARKLLAEHYLKADRSRALVLGRNRVDWWSPSDTTVDSIRRNLQICGHLTGRPCVVYAVDNEAIVRTPQRMRAVDVFVPQDIAGLDDGQREALHRYLIADDWRAVAVSRNGRFGIVSGRSSERTAIDDAVRMCAQAGGTECAISAVGPFLVAPK